MEWQQVQSGYVLRGAEYDARLSGNSISFIFDGTQIARLPVVSSLDSIGEKEKLHDIRLVSINDGETAYLSYTAGSSIWDERKFEWRFEPRMVSFSHKAKGTAALGRCFFFSSGPSDTYSNGESEGYNSNAHFDVPYYFTPNVNLGNIDQFDISQPGSVGIKAENSPNGYFTPERYSGLFNPSPLFYAFYKDNAVMGIGLGTAPGNYRFNSFEYSGSKIAGASFHVNYFGYTDADGYFGSPEISINFGYDRFEVLQKHVDWIDERKYSTSFRFENAGWHRAPVFCGWAEQTVLASLDGSRASDKATQGNYEQWVNELEKRQIEVGTIVIDDGWAKQYGTFEIDIEKWPDMAGFIRKQHGKGRHVLLWIPGYQVQGIPKEWCICDEEGNALFADPANPEYEKFMREKIGYLVGEIGADGFKEDWIGATLNRAGLRCGELHGIELIRRFQWILHDETHTVKSDALIQTQTPHPLFRESSDMLRLNDIWYGARDVCRFMRMRARIARIAGWRLFDCDNASSTTINEWFNYAQLQVNLGIPSLYFLTETESGHERASEAHWRYLADLFSKYIRDNVSNADFT